MPRRSSSLVSDEELESRVSDAASRSRLEDESPLDARLLDLDDEAESPFLRGQKRVRVRRGPLPLPRNTSGRLKLAFMLIAVALGVAAIAMTLERYGTQSWRFRLESSDNIDIAGTHNVTRAEIMEMMASDLDRNVFFVPLEQRKRQLEQIPWVKSATVMRLLPNRLQITIAERVPVAFVEINSRIRLIDGDGVVMELPAGQSSKYSFPVIVGMSDYDPLSMRAARMKIYTEFMKELESGGGHYSADISDIDLSDPDDLKATVTDPKGTVLVHFGSANFLARFSLYVAHVEEWRTQFPNLQSVSLRYDHQVIVNGDSANSTAANSGSSAVATAPVAEPSAQKKTVLKKKNKRHS